MLPLIDVQTLIAFSSDSLVIICLAVIFLSKSSIIYRPVSSAICNLLACVAGINPPSGGVIPITSDKAHIVFAVPKNEHEPHDGQEWSSRILYCSSVIFPAASIPRASMLDVWSDFRPSNSIPPSIGPPGNRIAGISNLAAAISIPGTILSHEPSKIIPSSALICAIDSMESAINSLDGIM